MSIYILTMYGVHTVQIKGVYSTKNNALAAFNKLYEDTIPSYKNDFDGWHNFFLLEYDLDTNEEKSETELPYVSKRTPKVRT